MVLADGAGTPLGIHVEKASPSAVMLVEATLDNVSVKIGKHKQGKLNRLVADRAYDCNKLRALLVMRGVEPIIPAYHSMGRPSSLLSLRDNGSSKQVLLSSPSRLGKHGLKSYVKMWQFGRQRGYSEDLSLRKFLPKLTLSADYFSKIKNG
jgi:hypothetical protein